MDDILNAVANGMQDAELRERNRAKLRADFPLAIHDPGIREIASRIRLSNDTYQHAQKTTERLRDEIQQAYAIEEKHGQIVDSLTAALAALSEWGRMLSPSDVLKIVEAWSDELRKVGTP